jgi:hypothetical protein
MEMATLYIDTQYSKTQRKTPSPSSSPLGTHVFRLKKKAPRQTSSLQPRGQHARQASSWFVRKHLFLSVGAALGLLRFGCAQSASPPDGIPRSAQAQVHHRLREIDCIRDRRGKKKGTNVPATCLARIIAATFSLVRANSVPVCCRELVSSLLHIAALLPLSALSTDAVRLEKERKEGVEGDHTVFFPFCRTR